MFSASSLPPSPHDEANEFAHRSSPSSTLMLSYSSPSKAAFAAAQRAYPAEIKKHLRIALRVRRFVVDDDGDDDDNLGTDANAPTVTPAIRWRCLRGLWADLGLPEDLLGKAVQRGDREANQRLLSFLHGMNKNENDQNLDLQPRMPRSPPKFGSVIFASSCAGAFAHHETTKREATAAATLAAAKERDARSLSPTRPENTRSKRCRSTLLRVAARLADARSEVLAAAAAAAAATTATTTAGNGKRSDDADAAVVASAGASALLRLQCCLSEAQQELALCMQRRP